MIAAQYPVLQVVVPLVAAPLCAVVRFGRAAWVVAASASLIVLVIAWQLLQRTWTEGVIVYEVGGWAAPWGIEYRIDPLNALVLFVVAMVGASVMAFARPSAEREIPSDRIHLFYAAYLLCLTGLLGITVTGDVFNVFVFLEISSLSSYALIAMGRDRRALTASFRYLMMGSIGATFILIGIGFLYMMTGTLNMTDLRVLLPAVQHTATIHAAAAFITVGVFLKLAVFPLHLWLPNAYAYAPSAVTAFLAGTATKVAYYVLIRFTLTVFTPHFGVGLLRIPTLLLPLSIIAILAASLVAVFQTDVKRMFAYSSIAQVGYMTLGLSMVTVMGLRAGLLHVFNHALIKTCIFLSIGCMVYRLDSARLSDLNGLAKRMPWTFGAFVVGGASLIGVPLTSGFISKWYLVLAALERGWWPVAALVVVASLVALAYVWRVVEVAVFRPAPAGAEARCEAPLSLLIPTWALALANVAVGIHSTFPSEIAGRAATMLLQGAP